MRLPKIDTSNPTKLFWILFGGGIGFVVLIFFLISVGFFGSLPSADDLENPQKEIARLPYPLFKPEKDWETKGEVNNVCFPTGTITINDTIYIYYGAADEQIAVASVSLSELLRELKLNVIINPT